ncbi:MAG: DUF1772 domain-containing protein [Gammaproteobacteria bacterium]
MTAAAIIATLAAGLWAGAAIYIAFCEHPSALKVGVQYATAYFKPMSKRTAPLMMVLAAIGGIAGCMNWYYTGESAWMVGGALLLAMFPLTGMLIVPTNIRLINIDAEAEPERAARLHATLGRMHIIRTVLGSIPFVLFVFAL